MTEPSADPAAPPKSVEGGKRFAPSFLLELFTDPLDPGYADAAAARAEHGPKPPWRRVSALGLRTLTLVLVGFLLAVAYREAVAAEPERTRAHAGLVDEVKAGQERTDAMQAESERLRREVTAAEQAALGGGTEQLRRVREQQAAAGLAAVTGSGVVVRLSDAPAPIDPNTGRPSTTAVSRVLDVDLQSVVNALWAAGAEAIAINGQRLTATSTIRAAGDAVLVDFRPVTSPYEVAAIGPDDLERTFNHTAAAASMADLAEQYGLGFDNTVREPAEPAGGAGLDPALRPPGTASPRSDQMIAVLALIAGVVAGLLLQPTVPVVLQPYLPIAVVAALDAVFGGMRARLDGVFDDKQFVMSFVSNVLVAAFIVYLGDQLGVGGQLSTGVVVVLGVRIFGNVAAIRRHLFRA